MGRKMQRWLDSICAILYRNYHADEFRLGCYEATGPCNLNQGIDSHSHLSHATGCLTFSSLQVLYSHLSEEYTMLFHLDTPSFALTSVGVAKAGMLPFMATLVQIT